MTPQLQGDRIVGAQHAEPLLGTISRSWALEMPVAALLACALAAPSVLGDCKCHRAADDETTHFGGNETVVFVEQESHRRLEGTVHAPDDTKLGNALVEVFDHPEYLLGDKPWADRPQQKRLAACRTAADGKFCFPNLPPEKYELRSSIDSGWDVTHVYVIVDRNARRGGNLVVQMELGK
jgi:hypothetical protein